LNPVVLEHRTGVARVARNDERSRQGALRHRDVKRKAIVEKGGEHGERERHEAQADRELGSADEKAPVRVDEYVVESSRLNRLCDSDIG
jgi:hypothetical protein